MNGSVPISNSGRRDLKHLLVFRENFKIFRLAGGKKFFYGIQDGVPLKLKKLASTPSLNEYTYIVFVRKYLQKQLLLMLGALKRTLLFSKAACNISL
jgi:hypothetical protein